VGFRLGPVPDDVGFCPEERGGWRRLREPSFGALLLLAVPVALLLASGLLAAWAGAARLHGADAGAQVTLSPGALLLSLVGLVALAAVHELAHAAALPLRRGESATIVGLWPEKLTPYVSYQGALPRNRYLLVGLTPFLLLTGAPLLVGLLLGYRPPWLVAASVVNAFISSGDLIGAALLAWQTPRSAQVRSKGLETWWRARAQGACDETA
jgi:hypothetical protein